jgi:hypothetical protein
MVNFYINTLPEKRNAWRNASEINMAALEHEKRRNLMMDGNAPANHPQAQARGKWQAGWSVILKAPLHLLTILIG